MSSRLHFTCIQLPLYSAPRSRCNAAAPPYSVDMLTHLLPLFHLRAALRRSTASLSRFAHYAVLIVPTVRQFRREVTLKLWGILWGPSRQNEAKSG
jgi:hypothetical protein